MEPTRSFAPFKVVSEYTPSGDQPTAIADLTERITNGERDIVLLGATGTGKSATTAWLIEAVQRPTLVLAHNKTLAAQLVNELREMFPNNAVEYFVSYYDYYQPEAYVPSSDTFIEKDAAVNSHIEQMRLSATKALMERRDVIVVATVSSIYGLGDPESYLKMVLHLSRGEKIDQRDILRRLAELQYKRNDIDFDRSSYRVRGDVIDVYPADSDYEALRIELFERFACTDLWRVFADVPSQLEAWKARGLKLAVVSNFDQRLHDLLEGLGLNLWLDAVVISSQAGAAKPNPKPLQLALQALELEAHQVWHVGDSPADEQAARAAGIPCVLVKRP